MTETPSSPSIGETVSDAVQEVYAACAALRENVSSLSSRDLRSALAAIEASSRAIRDGKGANVSRDALERLAGVVKGTIEIGERAVWENSGASAKHDKESEVLSRMDAWAEKTESEKEEKRTRSTSIGRSSWLEIDAERAQEDARQATMLATLERQFPERGGRATAYWRVEMTTVTLERWRERNARRFCCKSIQRWPRSPIPRWSPRTWATARRRRA